MRKFVDDEAAIDGRHGHDRSEPRRLIDLEEEKEESDSPSKYPPKLVMQPQKFGHLSRIIEDC